MQAQAQPSKIMVDGYTRFCLTAIAVLLTVLIVGLWAEGPDPDRAAAAGARPAEGQAKGIPDSGAQRMAMIRELQTVNGKLDKLVGLLEGGKLQVIVANLEAKDATPNVPPPPGPGR